MQDELNEIKAEHQGFLLRRIILWVVRWMFGFAIVAVVVHHYPQLFWLWYVAAVICLMTPVTAFIAQQFVNKKIRELEQNLDNLHKQLEEAPGERGDS